MLRVISELVPTDAADRTSMVQMLPAEISGAATFYHSVSAGQSLHSCGSPKQLRVFVIFEGEADVADPEDGTQVRIEAKTTLVPGPGADLDLAAKTALRVLEIVWDLTEDDLRNLALSGTRFPIQQVYADAPQYRDYFKSEKTISRTLIAPKSLPRFAMGSVESIGPDHIQPHAHPMLDQLFFTFSENRITLLVDGAKHTVGGNTLLHIPLGSDHGVDLEEGNRMHYIWIDFFMEEKDMEYLVEVHLDVPSRSF